MVPPSSSTRFSISNRCREYFEVKPKGHILKEVCDKVRTTNTDHPTIESLLSALLLSEKEIHTTLPAVGAVVNPSNGAIRLFERSDIIIMIQMLFSTIIEKKLALESVPQSAIREFLQSSTNSRVLSISNLNDIQSLFYSAVRGN